MGTWTQGQKEAPLSLESPGVVFPESGESQPTAFAWHVLNPEKQLFLGWRASEDRGVPGEMHPSAPGLLSVQQITSGHKEAAHKGRQV